MPELLLEVLSEEIPARMQARATTDLRRLVTEKLKETGLEFNASEAFATPRRLMLVVDGLTVRTEDVREERRGPKVGAPDKALEGFCRGNGVALGDLEQRDTPQGTYYYAIVEKPGEDTADVLPALLGDALQALPWPKSMRWADLPGRWVRPIHGLLAIFNGEILNLSIGDAQATNMTRGHRFMAPEAFEVTSFLNYKKQIRAAHVIIDPLERRTTIKKGAQALAATASCSVQDDDGLLDEVSGLVEYPVPLMGRIDGEFMDLPPEVMTTAMRSHQKYFSLLDGDGKMAPYFITVANRTTQDDGQAVVAGNERVLRARLSDARFYWDQDQKIPLRGFVPALEDLVFHEKLGSLAGKVWRMEMLMPTIAGYIDGADRREAVEAARLCKADLTSGMVGEFPELQGIMGRYYALKDGESQGIADAIAQHYAPQGPNDICPTAPISVAVALADKIDTLVGFWGIDEQPTGSKDPYALRRATLGVIRLILENNIRMPLLTVFGAALDAYRANDVSLTVKTPDNLAGDLLSFFADRLKVYLRDQGVRHDLITAVLGEGDEDDLVRLLARVRALGTFLGTDDGANLLTAYKRAANIVRIEQEKDKTTYDGAVSEKALSEEQEVLLFKALSHTSESASPALQDEQFDTAMEYMAALRAPVDAFFDKVTVNCDDADIRVNRLKLLSHIRATLNQVADFSQIEGGDR